MDTEDQYRCIEAPLCFVVPILATGPYSIDLVDETMRLLKESGSWACPGFKDVEGVVVFHTASGTLYKCTYEYDQGKWSGIK